MSALGAASANKRSVRVISLARHVPRAGFRGDELHFADEIAAPGSIDPVAQLALHAFDLLLPCLRVRGHFKERAIASHGPRVGRESFPGDGRPCAREPRKRCFRPIESADYLSKKFACSLHGSGILTQTGGADWRACTEDLSMRKLRLHFCITSR
jgi:hypothetical protein